MDDSDPTPAARSLASIPRELLFAIVAHLSNHDRKCLRLTCKTFGELVLLRIDRVFLSPDPLNIQVFRSIADHDIYRQRVVELIYDDARLELPLRSPFTVCDCERQKALDEAFYQRWFEQECDRNLRAAHGRKGYDVHRPDHIARSRWMNAQAPSRVMWMHYKHLYSQQATVIKSNDDVSALRYGLEQFPSLRRITITPATYSAPFTPLYQTPMIRKFPFGFNFPIPRGWPTTDTYQRLRLPLWNGDSDEAELQRNRWRGFRIITKTLASMEHRISEFVVDVSLVNTGLNSHMFDEPCDEHDNLVVLLCNPGFRRLDLALLVDRQDYIGWPAFRNGRLYRALCLASDLEHFSMRTNAHYEPDSWDWAQDTRHFIPLRGLFPVHEWPKLRHFGLSSFVVKLDDLMSLLVALPGTVRSIELSFLIFHKNHGSHYELLRRMRDTLDWRDRELNERPRISMAWHQSGQEEEAGRAVWVDKEVNEYVYGNGENPFRESNPDHISLGFGIQKDLFEPAYERPYVSALELIEMGICRLPGMHENAAATGRG